MLSSTVRFVNKVFNVELKIHLRYCKFSQLKIITFPQLLYNSWQKTFFYKLHTKRLPLINHRKYTEETLKYLNKRLFEHETDILQYDTLNTLVAYRNET